jgi:hypothetical protein
MHRRVFLLLIVLTLLTLASTATAGLLDDLGDGGEYFHDDATGLFWFDPAVFLGWTRSDVETFSDLSSVWSLATGAQVDALVGSGVPWTFTLEEVMGPRQDTITGGGPRWVGFCAETSPDGWLLQSDTEPYDSITGSSSQGSTESFEHGAWMVAAVDPRTAPRLDHLGDTLIPYFHDQATGLYWVHPCSFVGMDRPAIVTWLADHSEWRWAERTEIESLVGKLGVGISDMVDILGEPQFTATGGVPRWIGYYAQETEPDGMAVQAGQGSLLNFLTWAGTQSSVENWDPGAWIVSDVNPTPIESRSFGEIKRLFAD